MKILFQGDSITDAGRNRENDNGKGSGYATVVSAKLGYDYPDQYIFVNRGISGNRISDLLARIKCDMINLKPDVISILIGVNDVWHEINCQNGIHMDLYENIYNIIIAELKKALPELRIMILEPFVLRGTATDEHWEEFQKEVALRAEAAKRVAIKNGVDFIPLQKKFDEACEKAAADYWLADGVHPTAAGHELIAKEWIKVFSRE